MKGIYIRKKTLSVFIRHRRSVVKMEREGSVKEDMSDSELDDLVNPSRLLDDLRGVYREHLMQIENVDSERDESYRVSFIYVYFFLLNLFVYGAIADLEISVAALFAPNLRSAIRKSVECCYFGHSTSASTLTNLLG